MTTVDKPLGQPNAVAALTVVCRGRPPRILVRGVNWLGDAVMTTPALTRLREAFPNAHLTLLTPRKLADLWIGHSAIDQVLVGSPSESLWAVGRQLRRGGFDLGVVLPNSPRSALELWLGRIPVRVGYAASWRSWWLTHLVSRDPNAVPMRKRSVSEIRRLTDGAKDGAPGTGSRFSSPNAHHVHHYLRLMAALGANPAPLAPRLTVTAQETQVVRTRFGLGDNGGAPPLLLGLNAGAEYGLAKRWLPERFAAVAAEVQRQTGCCWLLLGGAADVELAGGVEAEIRRLWGGRAGAGATRSVSPAVINLAGKTGLRDLCAVLACCRLLLTNDTGPMHVAAALGTPVVVPFGSTSAELTGPGLPGAPGHVLLEGSAPCAPCFRRTCPIDLRCLTSITVEQVTAAVLRRLSSAT